MKKPMRKPITENIIRTVRKPLVIGGVVLMVSAVTLGDTRDEIMREDLALIQTQLKHIEIALARVNKRQRQQSYQARKQGQPPRFYLDTKTLQADLRHIKQGISDFLNPKRMQPTVLAPLKGDYLKHH